MRPHVPALALTLALAAGMLVGCSDDPEPVFTEPSPTLTPPPSSQAPEPEEPEPWERRTPSGAAAFAELWTATFSDAFRSGSTDQLRALSKPGCETCQTFAELIESVYSDGGSIAGEEWRLTELSFAESSTKQRATVVGRMSIPEQTINRSGEAPKTSPKTTDRYVFELVWANGGWTAAQVLRDA